MPDCTCAPRSEIDRLAEVLIHEFGGYFDRSESAVDMTLRLLRAYVPHD